MKKISLIILICLLIPACTPKENYEKYNYVILRINMPLNFDDLDNLFEIPLQEILEKDYIGEITGDALPLNKEKIPCATDIEFEIRETKMNDFINLIKTYELPEDSYLYYNEKKEDLKGTLEGLELKIDNLSNETVNNLYNEITALNKYKYISSYKNNEIIERIYIFTNEINELTSEINNLIKNKQLENNITVLKMDNYCQE